MAFTTWHNHNNLYAKYFNYILQHFLTLINPVEQNEADFFYQSILLYTSKSNFIINKFNFAQIQRVSYTRSTSTINIPQALIKISIS